MRPGNALEMAQVQSRGLPGMVTPWLVPMIRAERALPMKPEGLGGGVGGKKAGGGCTGWGAGGGGSR